MPILQSDIMTAREKILLDTDLAENEKNRFHQLQLKQLDVDLKKSELKLRQEDRVKARLHNQRMAVLGAEQARYEASWQNVLRLPALIIKLPVYMLFGIAYIGYVVTKQEPPTEFWEFIGK